MAERRMFAKSVIDSDMFLDMPLSTQAVYFHLAMRADDDGFVTNPKRIQRMIGASDDELRMLVAKQYLIPFESGVVVIKHWKVHNYIQKDRYHPSTLQEKECLKLSNSNTYEVMDTECIQPCIQECIQDGNIGKVRLGKVRLGKVRLDNMSSKLDNDDELSTVKDVVSYLNNQTGKSYKATSKATQRHIKARLNEGYTLDDFQKVIDRKCREWQGTKMDKYLRPETLFGSKFEGYLNESDVTELPHTTGNKQADMVSRTLAMLDEMEADDE